MDLFDGSPRERNLLIGLGVIIAGMIVFLLLRGLGGGPATTAVADRDTALRELQLVESALSSTDLAAAPATERVPFDRSAIIRGAQGAGLTLSRIEPQGGGFTVTFDPAPGASLLRFLRGIEQTTTGTITDLRLDATDGGLVDAEVTFEPGT